MNDSIGCILAYGRDAMLLQTRAWILKSRGYRVTTVMKVAEFDGIAEIPPVSLLLLCHSLDPENCAEALAAGRSRWPGIKTIVMARNVLTSPSNGEMVFALEGPQRLLSAVTALLGEPQVTALA